MLPAFQSRPPYPWKVLPDGVYQLDEAAFRLATVTSFPASTTRGPIHAGFTKLRAEAAAVGIHATQWVDGSFVVEKNDPEDVDVVSFLDYDILNRSPPHVQSFVKTRLAGNETTKPGYRTQTFAVPSATPGHPWFPAFEAGRHYWRKWFGRAYDKSHPAGNAQPHVEKGFVELALGTGPTISHSRGSP